MTRRSPPFLLVLVPLLGTIAAAAAQTPSFQGLPGQPPLPILPPGYVEEPDNPPEDPLPPPPRELPVAPSGPVVAAPDPADLLKACREQAFTDCFRLWQPPPPPPPPPEPEPKAEAKANPPPAGPPDPKAPREPAKGGPLTGPPPAPQPEADKQTFDALVKALKDSGLDGKVMVGDPPKDGSATLKLDSKPPAKPAGKPAAAKPQ